MEEERSIIEILAIFGFFLVWGGALLLFNRTTVPRIDSRIEQAGHSKEMSIDVMGTRALWFSDVLALGFLGINSGNYPFINGELINEHATRYDKLLGFIVSVSLYGMILILLVSWFIRMFIL
ncbi:MAG: hypothetical protein VXZ24_09040 [Pseudomonadota bacterium]|jgi:hypothetical protein|nr:hypothetical protein [Pseudomonadota bacterium]MEC8524367.1 hypothetical protein [Pseudomonadota bacterium]